MSAEYINGYENLATDTDVLSGRKQIGGIASYNLKLEAIRAIDDSKYVFNFAYTNYGGSILDRAMIEFAKEYYPDCLVWEETDWSGQNAYIFGELAEEFAQSDEWYYTDFSRGGYFFDYLSEEIEQPMEKEGFDEIVENFDEGYKEEVLNVLCDNFVGYWSFEPNFLDYSIEDLKEYLEPLGIAPKFGW